VTVKADRWLPRPRNPADGIRLAERAVPPVTAKADRWLPRPRNPADGIRLAE
jgi:hypothetical protein